MTECSINFVSCFLSLLHYDDVMNFYQIFKTLAFKLDPEVAHEYTLKALENFKQVSKWSFPPIHTSLKKYSLKSGLLKWNFPVGIAAGLDKDARVIDFFHHLKVGGLEIGTVTPKAQQGNPKPRIWRYPEQMSLRNAMGFPNEGSSRILENLKKSSHSHLCLGVNIGKNKETSVEKTAAEYASLYETFHAYANYVAINISSPNTTGLREFQEAKALSAILQAIDKKETPILVKIAPDLSENQISEIVKVCFDNKADGIIATNTTKIESMGPGGVSGRLLTEKSFKVQEQVLSLTKGEENFSFIGVGGFENFEQVKAYWKMGGRLLQIYTSFVYQGPQFFYQVKKEIDKALIQYQCNYLEELITLPEFLKKS